VPVQVRMAGVQDTLLAHTLLEVVDFLPDHVELCVLLTQVRWQQTMGSKG
jgi:hypothetical protein